MDTKALAAGIVGFLLGGLVVSIAAQTDDTSSPPAHEATAVHQTVDR